MVEGSSHKRGDEHRQADQRRQPRQRAQHRDSRDVDQSVRQPGAKEHLGPQGRQVARLARDVDHQDERGEEDEVLLQVVVGTVGALHPRADGRGLVKRYEAVKSERLEGVLEAFSAQELEQLSRLLERFSIALLRTEINGEGLCLRCSAYFDDRCPVQHLHEGCPYHRVIEGRNKRATEVAK